MSGTGHLTVYRGKKIIIHFKDGTKLITKFFDKKGKKIQTEDGTFLGGDIRTISIYKEKSV